jgi:hypothetical protein
MPKQARPQLSPTVFISHVTADNALAHRVRDLLRSSLDAKVFTSEDLSAGENWEAQLRKQLSASDYVVALVSPKSVHSTYVLQDLGAAWALRKPIISVATRPDVVSTLPVPASEYQLIELKNIDDPDYADDLARQFSSMIGTNPVR